MRQGEEIPEDLEIDIQKIRELLADLSPDTRNALINAFLSRDVSDNMLYNTALMRLFGPSNPDNLSRECDDFGGCRMLLCDCKVQETDILSGVDEKFDNEDFRTGWFKGYCSSCFNRIERPSHSLRVPLVGGRMGRSLLQLELSRGEKRWNRCKHSTNVVPIFRYPKFFWNSR